jgi:hypothetical protein
MIAHLSFIRDGLGPRTVKLILLALVPDSAVAFAASRYTC